MIDSRQASEHIEDCLPYVSLCNLYMKYNYSSRILELSKNLLAHLVVV